MSDYRMTSQGPGQGGADAPSDVARGVTGDRARIEFPDGDFYSCSDPETLTCTEPEEALEQYLDGDLDPKMTVAEVVASIRARPITVTAYKPMEISDKQIETWADRLLETLAEDFSEEHGDPDGGPGDGFPSDAEKVLREAVTSIIRRSRVWSCAVVGKVTLTPDQIEELMREWCPDWFETTEPTEPAPRIVRFEDKP
jgi:hypothetical protein